MIICDRCAEKIGTMKSDHTTTIQAQFATEKEPMWWRNYHLCRGCRKSLTMALGLFVTDFLKIKKEAE